MRKHLWTLAAALLAAALGLTAGCGGQKASAPVDTSTVEMPKSYRFDPAVVRVVAGSTVTFHNSDNFTHSVYVEQTKDFRDPIPPGGSATLTFTTPGEYTFYCTYHSQQMQGKIIVTARQ